RFPASPNGNWRTTSGPCPAAVASAPIATPNRYTSMSGPSATGTGAAAGAAAVTTAERRDLTGRSLRADNIGPLDNSQNFRDWPKRHCTAAAPLGSGACAASLRSLLGPE